MFAKRSAANFGLRLRSLRLVAAERRIDALYFAHLAGSRVKRFLPARLAAHLRWPG